MFKQRLLVVFAMTAVLAAGWALWVNACDQNKQTSHATSGRGGGVTAVAAGAGKGNCTAEMAAQCTAAMAAECTAHGATKASAASMAGCPQHAKGTMASNASMTGHDGCTMKSGAAAASKAGHDGCAMMSGATAAGTSCEGHGTMASNASMTGGKDCCAAKGAKGASAANAGCDSKMMGAGMIGAPSCPSHGTSATAAGMEGECDACAEMVTCAAQLSMNGVQTQAVPLKNGIMFVYTSDTPSHVRGIQNVLARRNDRLNVLAQAGDHAKLCPECRTARGAIASGKLTRETVNIEGGCMTLVTSSDPATVAKLRAMATMGNARTKS
jgi:hypothetical protein